MVKLFMGIAILGIVCMAVGMVSGIGYFFYQLANDVKVGTSLWNGFVLFISMLTGGGLLALTGYIGVMKLE